MMTVKHIAMSGEEYIYPTSHVNYVPVSALANQRDAVDTLWLYPPDQPAQPLTGGTVFVMNEHGKTVSKYSLSDQSPFGLQNPPLDGLGNLA